MAVRARSGGIFTGRRANVIRENLTAYAFLAPAMVLIFIFGIFPVGFAFFVSLHRWRRFPGEYLGLGNYIRALDDVAYILFFWLSIGAILYGVALLIKLIRSARSGDLNGGWNAGQIGAALSYLIPGGAAALAIMTFINWTSILLPLILEVPTRLRGQELTTELFVGELFASFVYPEAVAAGNLFLIALIAALVLGAIWTRVLRTLAGTRLYLAGAVVFFAIAGGLMLDLTLREINFAIATAQEAVETLPLWTQIILISAGAGLVVVAYLLWQRAVDQPENRRFIVMGLAALALLTGGYLLIAEMPRALADADFNVLDGFSVTIMFALGTVPVQLAVGLVLAYLLFQNIRGKSFFRVVYFLPYIMPFVATSIVFNILFSQRPTSLANHVFTFFGLPVQKWLLEPTGVIQLVAPGVPEFLAGPSLALVVIMIYTIWTYIGYDTAVFLAGLGNIPNELYEAAKIDGANAWALFRYITLPLLSPTTFFLSLIAIIGTFQAFTQIWIMRTPAAASSVDTIGVYIFETIRSTDPNMGYGSALSFVLFGAILLLTLVQNRLAARRVFYG